MPDPENTASAPADYVPSTSDARTVNNTMRHQYRVLTDQEKRYVDQIKSMGASFADLLHEIGGTGPYAPVHPGTDAFDPERFGSRNLALSFGHIEDAVYRAVKHITA